jgi:hypothetical protein
MPKYDAGDIIKIDAVYDFPGLLVKYALITKIADNNYFYNFIDNSEQIVSLIKEIDADTAVTLHA